MIPVCVFETRRHVATKRGVSPAGSLCAPATDAASNATTDAIAARLSKVVITALLRTRKIRRLRGDVAMFFIKLRHCYAHADDCSITSAWPVRATAMPLTKITRSWDA